ncbi:MAG: outer membrane beta-barrel protein [Vicinamibacterales bacterium]|nr:outer membrane beta-barrel protein [Vicinamibacterales bacterium]
MRAHVIGAMVLGLGLLAGATAQAQSGAGPRVDVTLIPAGGIYFTEEGSEPDFGSYAAGAAVGVPVNRFVGLEGEVTGLVGIEQDLTFNGRTQSLKAPHMLAYSGNVVIYPAGHDRGLAPYVTGGAGGLTVYERPSVGVSASTTFFSANAGGGLTYTVNDHVGVRGDYRFIGVLSKDDAPAFFGRQTRYAHRVYGGLVITVGR